MIVELPCRLRERFRCEKPYNLGWCYLTGMDFFAWTLNSMAPVTLHGKEDLWDDRKRTHFFSANNLQDGVNIALEVPDEMLMPGYPLRKMGLDTDAVGWLHGLALEERGWSYYIKYGRDYDAPLKKVRTEILDKLFAPVLPLCAMDVDCMKYLIGGEDDG